MLTPGEPSARFYSRTRWYVLAGIFLLSSITIVDRVTISVSKSAMSRDLSISNIDFGGVFGAFALGYAVLMVPSGWLADRLGPRRFLAITVAMWSCFTLGTGMVRTLAPLVAVRFAFGMAEAGAYPTATRAIYNWFPMRERGLALGLLNTGSRLGAAFGLAIMSMSVVHLGWRLSYYLLAGVGLLWAAGWFIWFRDVPSPEHSVPAARSDCQPGSGRARATWRSFLGSRNFYLILCQYFASNFTFFICFSWLLPYIQDRYHLSASEAGFYASIPLYCGALATWLGGYLVDAIFKMGYWKISRVLPAAFGFGLAAVCLLIAGSLNSVQSFIVCFGLATLGVDLSLSPSWTTCSDVGREFTGTLSGSMNMMGSLGSFCSSLAFPYLLKVTGNPQTYFLTAAALNAVAILCWIGVRPDRPLSAQE
jgi:ACS family glucarate transporter-like MFS transporter